MKRVHHWINWGLLWAMFGGLLIATTLQFSLLKLLLCLGTYLGLALYSRFLEQP
jgi:hypothetical protein